MDPIRCPHARKAAPVTSTLTLNFLERKRCVEHIREKNDGVRRKSSE